MEALQYSRGYRNRLGRSGRMGPYKELRAKQARWDLRIYVPLLLSAAVQGALLCLYYQQRYRSERLIYISTVVMNNIMDIPVVVRHNDGRISMAPPPMPLVPRSSPPAKSEDGITLKFR